MTILPVALNFSRGDFTDFVLICLEGTLIAGSYLLLKLRLTYFGQF